MSGELLLSGSMGVDARRAAQKIRDHLLAQPSSWLCEIARVATLSGAKRLAIRLRALGATIEWDGQQLPPDLVEQFGRHLLSAEIEPAPKRGTKAKKRRHDRRLELLTLAVFAALGDEALAVELAIATPEGALSRRMVRAEVEQVLERAEPATAHVGAFELPGAVARFEIDLAFGLPALGRAFGVGGVPAAVLELRRRLGGGLSVTVDGEAWSPPASTALLSVEAGTVQGLALRLDLLPTNQPEPRVVFHELGVEIARAGLFGGEALEAPLGISVSGDEVATNVSRSQVAAQVESAVRAELEKALPKLCDALKQALSEALERRDEARFALLEQAAGRLAVAALPLTTDGPLRAFDRAFAPTLRWPLLADATGRAISIADAQSRKRGDHFIARRSEHPLPDKYGPLVRDVFWARGRAAEAALLPCVDYETIAEEVHRGMIRLASLAHLPVEAAPRGRAIASARLSEPDGFEADLRLELLANTTSSIRAFVGEHLIEEIEVQSPSLLYRYAAAARWPGVLLAKRSMDAVVRGFDFGRLLGRLERHARAQLAAHLSSGDLTVPGDLRSLALRCLAVDGAAHDELGDLKLFVGLDGEARSLRELRSHAKKRRALLYVGDDSLAPAKSGKGSLIVRLNLSDRELCAKLLEKVVLCDVGFAVARQPGTLASVRAERELLGDDAVVFEHRGLVVGAAPALGGRYVGMFRGQRLCDVALGPARPQMLCVSDGEDPVLDRDDRWPALLDTAARKLVDHLAADLERMRRAALLPGVRALLAARLEKGSEKQLAAARQWPMFLVASPHAADEVLSANELKIRFAGPVPAVEPAHRFATKEPALLASDSDRRVLFRVARLTCAPRDNRIGAEPAARTPPPSAAAPPAPSNAPPSADLLSEIRPLMPQPTEVTKPETRPPMRVAPPASWSKPPEPVWVSAPASGATARPVVAETVVPRPSGLWDRMFGALGQRPDAAAAPDHPLTLLSRRAREHLPVPDLQLALVSGSPLAFDRRKATLEVDPRHATVRTLVEHGEWLPLVAAAYSEINRELGVVTDAQELRALCLLVLDPPRSL